MQVDANTLGPAPFGERVFDLCIVGAGVVGITLAREMSRTGLSVILLEAGGADYEIESQDLYRGESVGMDYFDLDLPRLRYLGGSSNHWGGWCRPLDDIDFEARDYVPWSGWPIDRATLEPFLDRTHEVLEISAGPDQRDSDERLESDTLGYQQFWSSPPTRFGTRYGPELVASNKVTLVLNANVTDIRLSSRLNRVTGVVVRNYGDLEFPVSARSYVICTGGLEVPRMLLNASSQMNTGIGNGRDLVGRFFSEHLTYTLGEYIQEDPGSRYAHRTVVGPTAEFLDSAGLLNFRLRLEPLEGNFLDRIVKAAACEYDMIGRIVETLIKPVEDHWCYDGRVRIASEQAPNPDSRVALSSERDRFGNRQISLDWRFGDLEAQTVRGALMEFGRHFIDTGLGRIHVRDWVLSDPVAWPDTSQDYVAGRHHMGTTRMSDNPTTGVVDLNLKVFETDNLYIGGSSVFATGGHTNPTFTIVQLTLRLADHLSGILRTRA